MLKILVTNVGFGQSSPKALKQLEMYAQVVLNSASIRYDEKTLIELMKDADILIAGTELISSKVLKVAKKLKLIARVGIGVDNIDLEEASTSKISICYTPEAPSKALPEFTLALMLNLIKHIGFIDRKMHQGQWVRKYGQSLSSLKIGVLGAGKIGSQIIKLLKRLYPQSIIYYYDPHVDLINDAVKLNLENLFEQSDLITVHIPLNTHTKNLVNKSLLKKMKKGSYLINTSRGGIVDENALFESLTDGHLAAAALDVYEQEPYTGSLTQLDNCILTSHIGSMTQDVRALMEDQIVEDIIRFINLEDLLRPLIGYNFK